VTFHNADNAWTVARVRVASFDVASLPIGASAAPNAGRPKYKRRKPKKPPAKSGVNGGGSKAETIITVVGHIPGAAEGRNLRMRGDWRDDEKWGTQFVLNASPEELAPPTDEPAMLRYLSGGALPGCGKVTAERLVTHFGARTFEVLDSPDATRELTRCPGVGAKTAEKLKKNWDVTRGRRGATAFLEEHGVYPALAQRVAAKYGANTEEEVKKDPFEALYMLRGATFHRADALAARLGKSADDPARLAAAMLQVLNVNASSEGHVYLHWREMRDGVARLLGPKQAAGLQKGALVAAADELLAKKRINRIVAPAKGADEAASASDDEHDASWARYGVFAAVLYDAEAHVAKDIARRLKMQKRAPDAPRVRRWLKAAAEREGWRLLSPAQEAFLDLALREPISVLTGGPGTGKTFAVHIAVRLWRAMGRKVLMCAPTGRAAQRLAEIASAGRSMSSPVQSSTIHRLLEQRAGKRGGAGEEDDDPSDALEFAWKGKFARCKASPLDADVVVVDESSMLDLPLCAALLDAVKPDAQVVFVGDADQLPSVGPGSVLRDVLQSRAVPAVQLSEVFRQAEQSGIIRAAHSMNAGRIPEVPTRRWDDATRTIVGPGPGGGGGASSNANQSGPLSYQTETWEGADCVWVTVPEDGENAYEGALAALFDGALPALDGLNPTTDLQVLTPFRRGVASTSQLNVFLQERLNPPSDGRLETKAGEITFREGDRVLQQRNDYAKEVFNGDLGTVVAVDGDGSVRVVFGGGAGTSGAGSSAGANESTRGEYDDDTHDAGADSAAAGAADSSRRLTDTVAMASRSLRHGAREVSYSKSELRDLIPAWALTVHKAQGSEYRAVVLCLAESHRPLLRRELAYTAASRAKEVLVILAPGPALELAVRALGNNRRCTTLARRLEPLAPDAPSCPAEAAIAAAADEKKRRTKPPSDDRDDAEAIRR
jgi:exodeoxyribonuclease V alpha subunit